MKVITLLFLSLISCHLSNIVDTSGNFDFGSDGKILDTPNNRKLTVTNYAKQVEIEASGKYPNINWNSKWKSIITALRSGKSENPEFYAKYIIDERRRQGLPEL